MDKCWPSGTQDVLLFCVWDLTLGIASRTPISIRLSWDFELASERERPIDGLSDQSLIARNKYWAVKSSCDRYPELRVCAQRNYYLFSNIWLINIIFLTLESRLWTGFPKRQLYSEETANYLWVVLCLKINFDHDLCHNRHNMRY